jgi:molybdenum cofactor cytidylyltransferase
MPRTFGLVPAAGKSVRMGEPKLLLPWGDRSLIEQTLAAWRRSKVDQIVVVAPPGADELARICSAVGATVVVAPAQPAEMKDSIRLGLDFVANSWSPTAADAWLLAPADMPELSAAVIDRLLAAHQPDQPQILVPTIAGRRGHPVLFPWPLAEKVHRLGTEEGLNALVQREGAREIPCDAAADPTAFRDIDTPADYQERPQ